MRQRGRRRQGGWCRYGSERRFGEDHNEVDKSFAVNADSLGREGGDLGDERRRLSALAADGMDWVLLPVPLRARVQGILEMPGKRYGRVEFDAFAEICWDFKAHAANTMRHDLITNDSEAIANAIQEYGHYGLILAIGEVEYNDEERTFKKWHDALKGGRSNYELARIERGAMSRRRKTEFVLKEIHIIHLDSSALNTCSGSFQEGFRNADGRPRRKKVLVNIPNIPNTSIAKTARF